MKNRFYDLCIFRRIQGTIVNLGAVEKWRVLTRKREAQVAANAYNRKHYRYENGKPFEDTWCAPEIS